MNVCAVDGCERPRERRQWCRAHYQRWRRHGRGELADRLARLETARQEGAWV